jgi:cellulose synthase/poly-beta-1,6-N-acetylglucosamine synthase-like glycosyltransferase
MNTAGLILIVIGMFGLSLFGIVYPLTTWLASVKRSVRTRPAYTSAFSVSLIIVVRNGSQFIGQKIDNSLALSMPVGGLEIIVHSDGSTDGTVEVVMAYSKRGVRLSLANDHLGKSFGLNAAAALATGDILVFSDADALLASDALSNLIPWFQDDRLGGVCGRRLIFDRSDDFCIAQDNYVNFDTLIKSWESRLGALTSNDGKLYAVRRELFPMVPDGVTDDLYVALEVVRAQKQFLFDAGALARIALPSRTPGHELMRRRRIVSTSLNAIALQGSLLNPKRYGFYSFRLFTNKVVRRLMPLFLIMMLAGSTIAATATPLAMWMLAAQLGVLFLAMISLIHRDGRGSTISRISSTAGYFLIGNLGMLLGIIDYLRGNLPTRWNPDKEKPHHEQA